MWKVGIGAPESGRGGYSGNSKGEGTIAGQHPLGSGHHKSCGGTIPEIGAHALLRRVPPEGGARLAYFGVGIGCLFSKRGDGLFGMGCPGGIALVNSDILVGINLQIKCHYAEKCKMGEKNQNKG